MDREPGTRSPALNRELKEFKNVWNVFQETNREATKKGKHNENKKSVVNKAGLRSITDPGQRNRSRRCRIQGAGLAIRARRRCAARGITEGEPKCSRYSMISKR